MKGILQVQVSCYLLPTPSCNTDVQLGTFDRCDRLAHLFPGSTTSFLKSSKGYLKNQNFTGSLAARVSSVSQFVQGGGVEVCR